MKRGRLIPIITLLFIVFMLLAFVMRNNAFTKASYITSDAEGYYAYLPKWFIYKDFNSLPIRTEGRYKWDKSGQYFNKYSCGTAIVQMPFFIASHAIAKSMGYVDNGYSKIYEKGILVSSVTFVFIGLFFLFRLQRLLGINAWVAAMVAGIVFFGTNLMYYTFRDAGMSHAYSFSLISIFSYFGFRYKSEILDKKPISFSILMALIGMIRLPNLIVLIIPAYYVIKEWSSFKDGLEWIKSHLTKLILILLPFILLFSVQMKQWHEMTGLWIWNGYGLVEPGFVNWDNPRIFSVLFNIKNGWFIYTPVMAISLILSVLRFKRFKDHLLIVLVVFILSTYLFGSWWVWSFAGGFGHRAYIDFLTILILPLGLVLSEIWNLKNKITFYSLSFLLAVLVFFNIGMSLKYNWPWEPPSWSWEKYYSMIIDIIQFDFSNVN